MNRKFVWVMTTVALLATAGAWAQDDGDDDDATTMRLMGAAEADLPDAVTKEIVLPESAADQAAMKAADGLLKAEERQERREHGLETADDARDNASDAADDALDSVEDRGRSHDLPDQVPDHPDRSDVSNAP